LGSLQDVPNPPPTHPLFPSQTIKSCRIKQEKKKKKKKYLLSYAPRKSKGKKQQYNSETKTFSSLFLFYRDIRVGGVGGDNDLKQVSPCADAALFHATPLSPVLLYNFVLLLFFSLSVLNTFFGYCFEIFGENSALSCCYMFLKGS
jgi:hypothetical protein